MSGRHKKMWKGDDEMLQLACSSGGGERSFARAGRVRRALARGVTLIEILIVLAIVGMIAGGVAVYAVPQFAKAQVKQAETDARAIQPVADRYRVEHPGECPTVASLRAAKELSSASKTTDPWDGEYKITCADDETIVSSAGPDKKENTKDDIRIPPAE